MVCQPKVERGRTERNGMEWSGTGGAERCGERFGILKTMRKSQQEFSIKTFSEKVVEIALSIPKGRVTTYGRIARAAGGGGQSARSVTAILGSATQAGEKRIPYHRIVYADGRAWLGGSYGAKRRKLYKEEGIKLDARGRIENFYDVLFEFE